MATPGSTSNFPEDSIGHRKEGSDWSVIFNPKVKRVLDVTLVHTLVHERWVYAPYLGVWNLLIFCSD